MKKHLIPIVSVLLLCFGIGTYLWVTTFDAVAEEKTIVDLTGEAAEKTTINATENAVEEEIVVDSTENENTASLNNVATTSGVYSYSEVAMNNGSLTMDDATLSTIINNTSIGGLTLKAGNGSIIMDSKYLSSLVAQSKGSIVFAFDISGNTVTVSAKTNGISIYGGKGICLISAIYNGNLNTSVVDSNGVPLGTSCYFAEAKELRWQMVKSEKYTITSTQVSFSDTTSHWGKDYIEFLASRGVVNGTSVSKFSPESKITRGQFITILNRISKENGVTYANNPYRDVKNNEYYFNAICWGTDAKIINGRTTTTFAPDATITREEMATMCYRYIEYLEVNMRAIRASADFLDISSVMAYALTPVKQCYAAGIINGIGDNRFIPSGNATRAEAASIVASLISYLTAMPH